MKRQLVIAAIACSAFACEMHDNASPFVHGAHVDPNTIAGSKTGAPTSSMPSQNAQSAYAQSGGGAGGVRTSTMGDSAGPSSGQPSTPASVPSEGTGIAGGTGATTTTK